MKKTGTLVLLVILAVLALVAWQWRNSPLWSQLLGGAPPQTATSTSTVAPDPGGLPQVYENSSKKFSIRYPQGYTVDEKYVYQELGPGKEISGVKFIIDSALAAGTNLSSDTYLSVEQMASTSACNAGNFLDGATVSNLSEGITRYSYATTSGAAAGNRYDEQVFALPSSRPCIAVRYFIHSAAIENFPPGTVQEFNRNALLRQFDAIRKTLMIVQ